MPNETMEDGKMAKVMVDLPTVNRLKKTGTIDINNDKPGLF